MILSVTLILLVAAVLLTIWHAANGQPPLWIAVLLILIVLLLQILPMK